jgi:hypothetical protein
LYAELIKDLVYLVGLNSTDDWQWCDRQNGTYKDCPIHKYADKTEFSMVVATHNPSNLAMETIEIKVPFDMLGFTVEQFTAPR